MLSTKRIIIPDEIIPSGNQFNNQHWAQKKRLVDIWFRIIRINSREFKWKKQKPVKFKVIIIRYAPRTLDEANLVLTADKLVLDNIKCKVRKRFPVNDGKYTYRNYITEGLIYDDDPEHLELDCRQVKSQERKMEIIIKEVKR